MVNLLCEWMVSLFWKIAFHIVLIVCIGSRELDATQKRRIFVIVRKANCSTRGSIWSHEGSGEWAASPVAQTVRGQQFAFFEEPLFESRALFL
jgi:hypothetical protein